MTALLRAASPAVQALLGTAPLAQPVWTADLFDVTLADGVTVYHWTSFDIPLTYAGVVYTAQKPWLARSTWNIANTMEVPTLTVFLRALNDSFASGANIKTQIAGGLFDGAFLLLSRAFVTLPGLGYFGGIVRPSVAGTIPLFGGDIGSIDIGGTTATIKVKGKVNRLDQNIPRNMVQVGCNHAFCDPGCALIRSDFTASFVVGANPTSSFIPWVTAPTLPLPTAYQFGTLSLTNGLGAGQRRSIARGDSTGLLLAYPLTIVPNAGDTFTAFQGCSKALSDGSGQSCKDHVKAIGGSPVDNSQNYRGYPYVPPPNSAY